MTPDPDEWRAALGALAELCGVATAYHSWRGEPVTVPAETIVAVMAALGIDASTPERAREALRERRLAPWRRLLPPCVIAEEGVETAIGVHAPAGERVEVWVEPEGGPPLLPLWVSAARTAPVEVDGVAVGAATVTLPVTLPLGWHTLHARSGDRHEAVPLALTPTRIPPPPARSWGLTVQLYSVRSRRSWGIGDLADLATLARWSGAELGAGFVLVNPLHAGAPVAPREDSPYLPSSRRFADPLYLAVDDIPEAAGLGADDRDRVRKLAAAQRVEPETGALIDRDAVWAAKAEALALLHRVPRAPERERAYRAYLVREGDTLDDYATWCALAERHGPRWRDWPASLRDPRSVAVAAARTALADRVEFHWWLQWLLDVQLTTAQRAAAEAGMAIGVVHDLAVGVSSDGADAWAWQELFAQGVTVGAPADQFNQLGQDWNQPPWRPDTLAASGYAPFRDLVRAALRHAGGLRIDHVMGLFRLWWVPAGAPPAAGTYVRYDAAAMCGVLALEAHRAAGTRLAAGAGSPAGAHGAVVVGEDLGTVEPGVREYLARRGVLGTSVLWFERDWHGVHVRAGAPLPPEHWRESALATVTTHDLPTTAAYLTGEHVELRHRLGLLTQPVEEERAVAAAERRDWVGMLTEQGLLPGPADGGGAADERRDEELVDALHGFLARTPCRLVGVHLPDVVGDRRPQNLPGTSSEYPNWRMPLADGAGREVLLEELVASDRARTLAGALRGVTARGLDA